MSKREAPVAIISMAQHARPNVMGHMLDSRAQLIACSSDVVMTLSSNRPSSQPMENSSNGDNPEARISPRSLSYSLPAPTSASSSVVGSGSSPDAASFSAD